MSTEKLTVLTIARASAPLPSPVIITLGVISKMEVVSGCTVNDEFISTLLADPVTMY